MYLAPLNYDRFFKKVFSHTHIAKAFLEDFLGETIEEIELLERTHLLTNSAMKVEVDFRCKIKGSNIIIDMQQWYKPDVVKRFYLYHCSSTVLQLENLPEKKLPIITTDKRAKDKDYREVVPVLTLIWMVSDSLKFEDNFVTYTTAPEMTLDFVGNTELWDRKNIHELLEVREIVLKTLNSNHKDLDFLRQNRLIFMFQNNIVKDEKFNAYRKWFEFAEKTRNKNNRAADFSPYKKEVIFKDMMRLILKKGLDVNDLEYIESEEEHAQLVERTLDGAREDGRIEGIEEGKKMGIEEGKQMGIEEGKQMGIEEGKQMGIEEGKQMGIEEGKQMGIEEGKQMGIEEGKQMGIEEGRKVAMIATTIRLHLKGNNANQIAELLDIAESEVAIMLKSAEEQGLI